MAPRQRLWSLDRARWLRRRRGRGVLDDRETAHCRRDQKRVSEAVALADRADAERAETDPGIECPDDRAEGARAAGRIGAAEDDRDECGVDGAEADSEERGRGDHLPTRVRDAEPTEREGHQDESWIEHSLRSDFVAEVREADAEEDERDRV